MDIDITSLTQTISGEVISPESSDYETARSVFAGSGSPAVIVRPQNTDDVVTSVHFARDHSMTLSVRSGGHHNAAFGTNDGGMVIDLSHMHTVDVYDKAEHRVRIGGGAKWGDVASILHQHGLAISSGDTKSVGVGGLTSSGGIGWMVREWGLAIDQLVGAEVVTAGGSVYHVSESENSDLFWAIRGGGGNFGVITQFEFSAHPIGDVYAGPVIYPADNIRKTIRKWRECCVDAPEQLSTSLTLMPAFTPEMSKSIMMLACYAGDDETAATTALKSFRQLADPISDKIAKKAYPDVLEEAHPPQGMKAFVNNILINELSDELIEQVAQVYDAGKWVFQIRHIAGAPNKVLADATAFAWRESQFMMFAGTFVPATAPASDLIEAAKPWEKLAAFGHGSYANFMSTRTDANTHAIYPDEVYRKLQKIKQEYDPTNLFNQNYNIKPAS